MGKFPCNTGRLQQLDLQALPVLAADVFHLIYRHPLGGLQRLCCRLRSLGPGCGGGRREALRPPFSSVLLVPRTHCPQASQASLGSEVFECGSPVPPRQVLVELLPQCLEAAPVPCTQAKLGDVEAGSMGHVDHEGIGQDQQLVLLGTEQQPLPSSAWWHQHITAQPLAPDTQRLCGARSPSPTCASSSMMWETLFQPKPTNLWSYLGQSRLTTT